MRARRRSPGSPAAKAIRRFAGAGCVLAALSIAACNSGTSAAPKEASCPELGNQVFLDSTEQGHYRVISPNGGEVFKVGDTLEVVVASGVNDSEALVQLAVTVNGTLKRVILPGLPPRSVNPRAKCRIRFPIPDSLEAGFGSKFSLVSDSVRIRIAWYNNESYQDFSDGYFRITR